MGKKKGKDRSPSTETPGNITCVIAGCKLSDYNHETSNMILLLLYKGFPALTSAKE